MKINKQERGITLIALIITIVVLLILAVVAISSIKNDGILGHATDVATDYNQAVKNEQDTLMSYEDFLKYQSCSGHEYNDEGVCTECGYSCKVQGGHTYGEWTQVDCSKERTCRVCGNKETVTEHAELETTYTQVNNSTTVHSKNEVCTKCKTVINSVEEAHTFVNSSCICNYACTSHTYGEWTTIAQADCSTETNGSKERICSICGNKETQTVTYEHQSIETNYTQVSEAVHSRNEVCTDCGTVIDSVEEQHSFYYGYCECGEPCDHNYSLGECTICHKPCNCVEDVYYSDTTSFNDYDGKQYHYAEANCAECGQYMWNGDYECTDANSDGKCDGCGNCTHKNGTFSWDHDEYGYNHLLSVTCPDCKVDYQGEWTGCTLGGDGVCDYCDWMYWYE